MRGELVMADLADAVGKLSRYAFARDRATERTPRVISISDDEAVALLMALGWVSKPLPPLRRRTTDDRDRRNPMICRVCKADRPEEVHLDWCTYDGPEPDDHYDDFDDEDDDR
jgi:hypothetical protein